MGRSFLAATALGFVLSALAGCGGDSPAEETAPAETPAEDTASIHEETAQELPTEITLTVKGLSFDGPSKAAAGWTTIRLNNVSGMEHFAVLQRLPEGITTEIQSAEVTPPFQHGLEYLLAGDTDSAMAEFGKLPAWYGDVVFMGGPGMVSGRKTTEATVYLEPGRYSLECYVKSGGVFHSFSPVPGELAMLHELVVEESGEGAPEPEANVTVTVSTAGYEITDGAFVSGPNVIRADYLDQTVYPNFVGHDVHIVRVSPETDMQALEGWMDWRVEGGLEAMSPFVFVGGLNEMPAGRHGYFTADLGAGDYALIAEVPAPASHGLLLPFTVE